MDRPAVQGPGKEIDRQTAEYLIFTCGGLMTGLVPEIAKIGAYAKGRAITQKDIDAVADPVLSAEVFRLSDRVITMYEGRITGEFSAAEISREEIGYCMTGGRREEAQA